MEECAEVDVCEDEPLGRVCLEAVKVNAEGARLGGGEDLVVVVVVVAPPGAVLPVPYETRTPNNTFLRPVHI